MSAVTATPQVTVGELLRSWRRRRSLSQLELSLDADISSRHLSFLETGRSRPSREMLLRLAGRLEVPLRERNALLLAAGYAPVYSQTPFDAPDMEIVRQAVDRFLRAHEPYPAVVIDRHHNLLAGNDALSLMTAGVDPGLLEPPANAIRIALHPDGMAPIVLNFAEWSARLVNRLRREARNTGDPELERLLEEVRHYPGVGWGDAESPGAGEILVPFRMRDPEGGRELAFFSTISTFGTATDITLAEMSIEAFYPANAATANRLLRDVGA